MERFKSTAALPPATPGKTVPVMEMELVVAAVGVMDAVMLAVALSASVPSVQVSVLPDKAHDPEVVVKVVAVTPEDVGGTGMTTVAPVLASGPMLVTT